MRRLRFTIGALLAVLWMAPLRAQEPPGAVRGRVVDEATQQPLSGVTVSVGGRSALTQADGRYTLTAVPAGIGTLRTRRIGYAPATRAITVASGQTAVVDIALTSQAVNLAEMVVVGYGEQSAGDITGAVKQLRTEDFNPGRIISPEQLIESKVAGVQVVDNNEPGGGMAIRIRGTTSISASSDPLYVVDGMPLGTGAGGGISAGRDALNFLNPDDIASVTVLKDASAAAIYGANASNGVVIITTKKGRGGPRVEYSGSVSSSSVTKLPSMLDAQQFRLAVRQYDSATGLPQLGSASTDWLNLISRSAFGQEHNLTVSGAGQANSYRISFGYLNQDGVVRGTNTRRLSLGFNYDQRLLSDRLSVKANLKGSRQYDEFTPGGVLGNAAQMGPTQPVKDTTSTYCNRASTGYYNWPRCTLTSADNPIEILNLAKSNGTTYRSVGNLQLDYTLPFFPALRANVNLGYDITNVTSQWFNPSTLHSELKQGFGGEVYHSNPSQANTVFETYLNYTSPLNVLPGNVDVTGGYSYAQSHQEWPSLYERGLSTDLFGTSQFPTAGTTTPGGPDIQESRLISFFGRVNYNYADRYIAAFSVRRDGSSRFGAANAWGNFPSLSLAWRLSQEPFLRSVPALSDLKLRASWASTGNQNFGNYLYRPTFQAGNAQAQAQFGTTFVSTLRPSAVDPNIKWEQTSAYNVGLDYAFRGDRFTGAIDWYSKKTTDMIFFVPIFAGNLSNFLTTNIGSMQNRGIELSLSARLLRGGRDRLSWTADFTAAYNANKLLTITPWGGAAQKISTGNISGGVGSTIQVLMPGQPVNSFFVYQQKYANGKPVYSDTLTNMYVDQPTVLDTIACPRTGTRAADCVGQYRPDGVINQSDLRPYHHPDPSWILGHTSYFTYRNFDLSLTLRAWLGNYVYNNQSSSTGFYRQLTSGSSPYNMNTSVLRTGFLKEQYWSDYYVQDASFLRMDNITVGYNFTYRGEQMRLFATVQNAFTITGYSGVDPTAGLNGIDNNMYPRSRTVTGGLSVRF